MFETTLESLLLLVLSIIILVLAYYYAIRVCVDEKNETTIWLIIITLFINIWVIFAIPFIIYISEEQISLTTKLLMLQIGFSFMFGAFIIIFRLILSNWFLSRHSRYWSHLCSANCVGIISLLLLDIVNQSQTVLKTYGTLDNYNYKLGAFPSLLIAFAVLFFFLGWLVLIKRLMKLPGYAFSFEKYRSFFLILFGAISICILILMASSFELIITTYRVTSYVLFFVSGISLAFNYAVYKQKLLLVVVGIKGKRLPRYLFSKGYLGFVFVTMNDLGPIPLLISPSIKEKAIVTEDSILKLGFFSTMVMGMGISNKYLEGFSLLPLPENSDYIVLAFTFTLKNDELTDSRIIDHCPNALLIVLPTILINTLAIHKLPSVSKNIIKELKSYETVEKINNSNTIKNLVIDFMVELQPI